ncbi:F0F1 ATP synthase subunit delta [Aquabacterium sp. J223]|uniref:F0F1 ATP synthase subunit delta n=1 Tax=Aquabacterium sp. J223 TaxID=2898431 RepID=UPI0021ADF545|nr:F0F1 ATP synthase subunit delta [Aquabacterium sp. J223]UUX96079.1 F0F1 ATP synthase subunit delta [Aquabacterium sp. J223]
MAEIATIARPYAEALLKAGGDQATSTQLQLLGALAGDPGLRAFAHHPGVPREQVVQLLADLATQQQGGPLSPPVANLLAAVVDNDRLDALPEVARQFQALINERTGVADAVVTSAFPIDDAQRAEIGQALERRFGRRLAIRSVEVDPELIGGIRVVVGDEVLDTSVKARLEQMKAALTA